VTTTNQGVATAPGEPPPQTRRRRWRVRWFLVTAAVIAIVVATVIVDLPESATRANEVQTARATILEITRYLAGCRYALRTSLLLDTKLSSKLSAVHQAELSSLAATDYAACSFTSQTIITLATIHASSSPAGKLLNTLVDETLTWCDVDAMGVVGSVSELIRRPHDRKAALDLMEGERRLDAERRTIRLTVDELARVLHVAALPQLKLVHAS
jgi:hypothetical protein